MHRIRSKLQMTPKLDGYQRKKYVAKILFSYLQGHKVDVGYMDAITLISSAKYSEKQIGYLTLTFLFHERSDLITLALNSIRKDLQSLNEDHTCLALHAIANMSNVVIAELVSEDILKLLVSPTSPVHVRKKAALALLRVLRESRDSVDVSDWIDRIVPLIKHRHLGLSECITSLVTELVRIDSDKYQVCFKPAYEQLYEIVVLQDCRQDYLYHNVPVPWLQVKLLTLLQLLPPPTENLVKIKLQELLHHILRPDKPLRSIPDIQESNAIYSVYFEAIRFAMHLDPASIFVARAAVQLGHLIAHKETNVRYLALETMTQLAQCLSSLEPIQMYRDVIFLLLRDKDISVRRRALDLLYAMCDDTNVQYIVGQLLRYLSVADVSLRQDMSLKISLLAELYASDSTWYIDTAMSLLELAGDRLRDELWYRIVLVVTNHPKVHAYAAERILHALSRSECHEIQIKLGAYLLGEYGYLIVNQPHCSAAQQFQCLHLHAHQCSPTTLAMLLSTYIKWIPMYPDMAPALEGVLRQHRHVMNVEMQQRANEYSVLAELERQGTLSLDQVLYELPPFNTQVLPEQTQAPGLFRLSKRISMQPAVSSVPRGEARQHMQHEKLSITVPSMLPVPMEPDTSFVSMPRDISTVTANTAEEDVDLLDLHSFRIMSPTGSDDLEAPWHADESLISPDGPLLASSKSSMRGLSHYANDSISSHASLPTSSSSEAHENVLHIPLSQTALLASHAVLHDTTTETITMVSSTTHKSTATVKLELHNKDATTALYLHTVHVAAPAPLEAHLAGMERGAMSIASEQRHTYTVEFVSHGSFTGTTDMVFHWTRGGAVPVTLHVALPMHVARFLRPTTMSVSDFFECWQYVKEYEAQGVVQVDQRTIEAYEATMQSMGLAILRGVDPRPDNVIAAGSMDIQQADRMGFLVRWEPRAECNVARLTVRSTQAYGAEALYALMVGLMEG
ncbi:clathrin-dependent endocytosis protein [Malassezia pachydermatis]|uniref:AP-2 complex subunit alpha n=1 Tax=Malassezia pachydermatis TaxID=77020 RepID=A0A0M8MUJ2_9BASI|nr:adaptor protein complex ap-2 alpha subunit [Malassezia pachydermatis]KOS14614.1 adaptor protein complex ap-2 alpha subunit [Malassezia pachydermatis]